MPCPHHDNIVHCPLYIESHTGANGCVDDIAEPCRVARCEMDYAQAAALLDRRMVAIVGFHERVEKFEQQRNRNMRILGLH